ncbi:myrosinase 1-like [Euwallacea similis]|uniref:myrosinase 1-like n=1 Tax=Euwallacea similis TaxID=1736056 RepID=UPI00344EFC2C
MILGYFTFAALSIVATTVQSETFPDEFIFGVATSAYQTEGAWNLSGKGESMWDWYTHTYPERISDGSNGDVACDSYNRYQEDISFLEDLGVQFYRFSISWPRILPTGYIHQINWEGVEFYLNILKALNALGIEPVVTLYHWDLPQVFNEMGGWSNPLLVDYFAEYSRLCYNLFGDYVRYWVTLNEPQTSCLNGYTYGDFAPGYQLSGIATYYCIYVHLLAHARAYHIYHDEFFETQQGKVSMVWVSYWMSPNSESEADVKAAERTMQFMMGMYAHPIFIGNWPQETIDIIDTRSELAGFARSRLPKFTDEQIEYIKGTADYFGLNYYSTYLINHLYEVTDQPHITSFGLDVGVSLNIHPLWPPSAASWLFDVPWGFREYINWIGDQYGNPEIFITENGWADHGETNDKDRIQYLNGHMCVVWKAINEDNRNIIGYTQWSLMDNFEWASGYTEKFGILSVDFKNNLTRIPKASYEWFKQVVQTKTINCTEF